MMNKNPNKPELAANLPPGSRISLVRAFTKKGIGSRSQAREWILAGRVKVNGAVQRFIYTWVDLTQDIIALDDQPIGHLTDKIYILFHKPAGYLTTRMDQSGRATIYDILPAFSSWIFPAGRLDMDSEGLLFLTNDGPMSEWLIHPDSGIVKTYCAQLNKKLMEGDQHRLREGIEIDGYRTKPADVTLMTNSKGNWAQIKISEGKNRQVRRMFEAVGYKVKRLVRTQIGPMALGDLPAGKWRYVNSEELSSLRNIKEGNI